MLGKIRALLLGGAVVMIWAGQAGADQTADPVIQSYDISDALLSVPEFKDFGQNSSGLDGLAAVMLPAADVPEHSAGFVENWFRRVETPKLGPYDFDTFWGQAKSIPIEFAALTAVPLYHGFDHWDWGKSSFHFTNEGWFGEDTKYLGMDKLGHAFTTYVYSDFFTQRIAHKVSDTTGAAITGAIMGMAIQTGVEIGDGFSPKYGFSPQDLIADGIGAGFSFLRNAVPGLANKLDFRMEYWKSPDNSFNPISDYDGQKYLLALKLSGFERFEETPLRFVELQAGYFARGVMPNSANNGVKRRREPYVAIGFNLQELIDETPARDTAPGVIAGRVLEYIQVPYTYVATTQN
jgi:hypothetical protein